MKKDIQLIVGLGNPGDQYIKTRHNIGFMVLDRFATKLNTSWKSSFKGLYTEITTLASKKIYFLKPQTYMNLSGESVSMFCKYYKILPEKIIVVHDELDFPFFSIKKKFGGSSGGHNGINSIINYFGTQNFYRLRLGIGKPDKKSSKISISDYVLGKFFPEELSRLDDLIDSAILEIKEIVTF